MALKKRRRPTRVKENRRALRNRARMSKADFPVASLPAPGRMHVDWEERVDFRRLHEYRLKRSRDAIASAGLGAVLDFDMKTIRYINATHNAECTRNEHAL